MRAALGAAERFLLTSCCARAGVALLCLCAPAAPVSAHCKASMLGSSVSIPITRGRLALGTWQVRPPAGRGSAGVRVLLLHMLGLCGGQALAAAARSVP